MTRLILHIGTHKTGTTAIQGFMKTNAKLLERDSGIFYPTYPARFARTKPAHNGNFLHCQTFHRMTGNRCRGDAKAGSEHIRERFLRQLEKHDTVMLSDEQIWRSLSLRKRYLHTMCELLDEWGIDQTDIIVYFRRQDAFVESYWKQMVKCDVHSTESLEEHLRNEKILAAPYLNYAKGVKRLEAAFGEGHVTVRRYQKDLLVNGDVRYDIADVLGFSITDEYVFPDESDDPRTKKGNVSYSNNLTEIMRAANYAPTFQEASRRDDLYRLLRNAARVASIASPESAKKLSALSPAQREQLLSQYKKSNAYVARKYFGIKSGRLFEAPDEDVEHWEPDALSLQHDSTIMFTEAISQLSLKVSALQAEAEASRAAFDELSAKVNERKRDKLVRLMGKLRKRLP